MTIAIEGAYLIDGNAPPFIILGFITGMIVLCLGVMNFFKEIIHLRIPLFGWQRSWTLKDCFVIVVIVYFLAQLAELFQILQKQHLLDKHILGFLIGASAGIALLFAVLLAHRVHQSPDL